MPAALLGSRPRTSRSGLLASLPLSERRSPGSVTEHEMPPSLLRAGSLDLDATETRGWVALGQGGAPASAHWTAEASTLSASRVLTPHPPVTSCSRAQGGSPGSQWLRAPLWLPAWFGPGSATCIVRHGPPEPVPALRLPPLHGPSGTLPNLSRVLFRNPRGQWGQGLS